MLEYDVRGRLLAAIKSLYEQLEVCVCVHGMKTKSFNVSVGLRQGCVLSPLLFIIYMDKIDKDSSCSSGVTFGYCNVWHLLFADDLALLSSNKSDLHYALHQFSDACLDAEMKISRAKTEIICLSRYPVQCSFQTNGVNLQQKEKFKHLGVIFSSDSRQDNKLAAFIAKASAVMRQLYRSVVLKRELCTKAKFSVFKTVFVPILTYGHECWVMTKRVRSRVQAAEMFFYEKSEVYPYLTRLKAQTFVNLSTSNRNYSTQNDCSCPGMAT